MTLRLGVDLGGTKTEIVAMRQNSQEVLLRRRISTIRSYEGVIRGIKELVDCAEAELGEKGTVGVGIPGAISPATGLVKNANSTWLIGHALDKDLEQVLSRPVRVKNDADCLALSEATDGAGAGYDTVWAVILGTGSGSGIVVRKRLVEGPNAIAGEWAHNPLPYLTPEEKAENPCYCGKSGCIEKMVSGTGLMKDYERETGLVKTGAEIDEASKNGEEAAERVLRRYEDRLARATAGVINILDPHIVVLGGGVSNIDRLYTSLPELWKKYVFSDTVRTKLAKAKYGDSSGVRGAAWLWND